MAALVLASSCKLLGAYSSVSVASACAAPSLTVLSHVRPGCQSATHSGFGLEVREQAGRRGPKVPCCTQAASSEAASSSSGDDEGEVTPNPAAFEEFVQLNIGSWRGSFTQYDMLGSTLQCIQTRLSSNSYGRGELCSLYQTMNVEQPRSMIFTGEDDYVPPWFEVKLDDITYETFSRRQMGFFPGAKAFTASHQTAELLTKVLRAGVLGEDDDEDDESPEGIKLPSRRPALVSESCLYSDDGEDRLRAFHVIDPRGFVDLVGVFREHKEAGEASEGCSILFQDSPAERLQDLVGKWSGRAITQRTGLYGSTFREGEVSVEYKLADEGSISAGFLSNFGPGVTATVNLVGSVNKSLLLFEGGLQTVLLPGGVSLTCPVSVGKSVGKSQSFYLEFAWSDRPGHRKRLVRTFDADGLVVSTTLSTEVKQTS